MIAFTAKTWPSDRWPNFNPFGFDRSMICSHTGKFFIDPEFMDDVQNIRHDIDRSLVVTSMFRDPTHPAEAKKAKPGAHPRGKAIDIGVNTGEFIHELVHLAYKYNMTGIGISTKVSGKFVHMDQVQPEECHIYRPALWTYS
jgi:zinc D-Ala-D-Ala carboxypeptidase